MPATDTWGAKRDTEQAKAKEMPHEGSQQA